MFADVGAAAAALPLPHLPWRTLTAFAALACLPKVRTLILLIAHIVLVFVLVNVERHIVSLRFLSGFPRSPAELLGRPSKRLLSLLNGGSFATDGSTQLSAATSSSGAAVLEPEKAQNRAPIRTAAGQDLFVKTGDAQSRGLPLWLAGLASFNGNREILFYRFVRHLLPTRSDAFDAPDLVFAAESRLLLRWCLIVSNKAPHGVVEYERDDDERGGLQSAKQKNGPPAASARRRASRSPSRRVGEAPSTTKGLDPLAYVVPDRHGCTLGQALAVMRGLASIHARFWASAHLNRDLSFLTGPRDGAPAGYVPAPAVKMLVNRALKKIPKIGQLWPILLKRLASTPVTLLHGDCRPENLLFHEHGGTGWRVTFLDWEAVGVNPAANDLIYFMVVGLRARDSGEYQTELLQEYLTSLKAACARQAQDGEVGGGDGGDGARMVQDYTLGRLRDEVALLGCVLLVVQACFAVTDIFKGWGNNKKNLLPWMVRLCEYTRRVDAKHVAKLLKAHAGEVDVEEIIESMQAKAQQGLTKFRLEHGDDVVDRL